jgi:hypothetical protein
MDLKEFIVAAISDISEAVSEADEKIKAAGGIVNPGSYKTGGTNELGGKNLRPQPPSPERFVAPSTTLNFDIAVSAASAKSGSGGVSGKIWVIEASLGGDAESKNETVSRLTFSIEVVLPHDRSQADRVGLVRAPAAQT